METGAPKKEHVYNFVNRVESETKQYMHVSETTELTKHNPLTDDHEGSQVVIRRLKRTSVTRTKPDTYDHTRKLKV